MINRFLLLLVLFLLSMSPVAGAQSAVASRAETTAASDERLLKLPADLRSQGAALLGERDDKRRATLASDLARKNPAATVEFLVSVLELDPSVAVRTAIVDRLGRYPHPALRQALQWRVLSDPDDTVALLALDYLRAQEAEDVSRLLARRLEQARRSGDEKRLRVLAKEQERWISLIKGTMLPGFMQVSPRLFSLKPPDQSIRVLAFGDFGTGSENQKQVAAAMLKYHQKAPFDFAVTLGDNFYSKGMESPADPRWKTWWDELYDPLEINFYASLGNHDWGFADSPASEILYSNKSRSWKMPATYYTFTAGPVQFFALDTNEVSEAQLLWLSDELKKSTATWKLVYGHHPIYSAGVHDDNPKLIGRLLPMLKGRADVYLAGHDHDMQHLKPEGSVHFFVSGGGGAGIRRITPGPRSLFAKSSHGFTVIEADARAMKFTFVSPDLATLYQYTITKPPSTASIPRRGNWKTLQRARSLRWRSMVPACITVPAAASITTL